MTAPAPRGQGPSMRIDGQCHCGAIAYAAEVDPGAVYLCHCSDCQAISGGTARWAVPVARAAFRLLRGETAVYVKRSARGTENHQHFCGCCAAPIYAVSPGAGEGVLRLRLGTCRQRGALPPRVEYWTGSAQPWALCPEATERRAAQ